jgi:hypothetical protein
MGFITTDEQHCEPINSNEYKEFRDDINFDSLQDMVDFLRYETIDELWSIFGELRACQRSPRPDEYAYFFIDQVSENFALSLVIPFDPTGQLSHCVRLTLETRERELQSQELCWEMSKSILEDVRDDIEDFLKSPDEEIMEAASSLCVVDHRFIYPSDERSASDPLGLGPEREG